MRVLCSLFSFITFCLSLPLLLIVLVCFSSFYLGTKFIRFYIYFLYVALYFCSSVSVI